MWDALPTPRQVIGAQRHSVAHTSVDTTPAGILAYARQRHVDRLPGDQFAALHRCVADELINEIAYGAAARGATQ